MKLRNYIKENDRVKLKDACFNKPLFKKELEKIIGRTSRHNLFFVLKYCYQMYSDKHADVLLEVYNDRIKNISKKPQVHAQA